MSQLYKLLVFHTLPVEMFPSYQDSLIPLTFVMLAGLTREVLLTAVQLLPDCITVVF
jgi:hypothetical protein